METPIKKRKIQVETPGTVFNEEGDEALFQDRYDLVNVQNSPLFVKDMKEGYVKGGYVRGGYVKGGEGI